MSVSPQAISTLLEGQGLAANTCRVRALESGFATAEWGKGVSINGARSTVEFALQTIGVHRLEARAAVGNGPGNGAPATIGALSESTPCRSVLRNGKHIDQALWSILREDRVQAKAVWGSKVH